MLLDLNIEFDREKFKSRIEKLLDKKVKVELTEKRELRSIVHNAYCHVCISLFCIHIGYTMDEGKTHLKRKCEFMKYEKNGELFLKKSSKLDSKGMADWIKWIRNYAGMQGVFIPDPDQYKRNWNEYEKTIEACKPYL